jgi:hypothetical protein
MYESLGMSRHLCKCMIGQSRPVFPNLSVPHFTLSEPENEELMKSKYNPPLIDLKINRSSSGVLTSGQIGKTYFHSFLSTCMPSTNAVSTAGPYLFPVCWVNPHRLKGCIRPSGFDFWFQGPWYSTERTVLCLGKVMRRVPVA